MSKTLRNCWTALLLSAALLLGTAMAADSDGRHVKNRVTPVYPDLARRMNIVGTVRIQVVIAANGTVKSTRVLGGHPLLIQSADDAIKKWRYEPGPEATTVVEFHFRHE